MSGLPERPFLTAGIAAVPGRLKEQPEDFEVDELPLYEPVGAGKHLYLQVEKRGIPTMEAVRRLARALQRPARDCGYAGMKDARAVTRQWISIPDVDAAQALAVELPDLRVLQAIPHGNKLKMGHLRGNRFRIRLRGLSEDDAPRVRQVFEILAARGVPNFYGTQRFGRQARNAVLGRLLLQGEPRAFIEALLEAGDQAPPRIQEAAAAYRAGELQKARKLWPRGDAAASKALASLVRCPDDWQRAQTAIPRKLLRFLFSAYQSALFNRYLALELERLDTLEDGAIAWLHRNGACFVVTSAEEEQARLRAFEVSPAGPIFGAQRMLPQGRLLAVEEAILAEEGLDDARLQASKRWGFKGARRPLRIPLQGLLFEREGEDLLVQFELPSGSYATEVFAEVFKQGAA